jgi:hypothetical protein
MPAIPMPPLDVLLPTRETRPWLARRAVASILAQTTRDLRLVVVDDGSSAEVLEAIGDAGRNDRRITVLPSRGRGIVAALRTGVAASDAPLVARMDADDLALPHRLADQLAAMAADPALDLVATAVELEGDARQGWQRHVSWSNGLATPEQHRAERFVDAPVVHPSVVFRRASYERWGGYADGPFPEDWELWLRALAAGARFAKVERAGLVWNRGAATETARGSRCSREALATLRSSWLAREIRERGGRFALWGAGPIARGLARDLRVHGLVPESIHDVDPRKIGRRRGGIVVEPVEALLARRAWDGGAVVIAAVGAAGAREIISARLAEHGARIGAHWLPAA